ncbi:hypothetical protein IWX49DRAFT_594914 [Phyllosticta citricarpa]|uniref:Uncharacterized protein n=1 Tax=Phyllosticta citricarpa TaxID=55181 RepID=A0ABR1LS17_9PEZI
MAVPPRPKMIAKLPMRPSNIVSSASPTLTPVTAFDRSTLPDRNVTWLVSVSDDLKKDHQGLMSASFATIWSVLENVDRDIGEATSRRKRRKRKTTIAWRWLKAMGKKFQTRKE